ncbi:LamG domain-containing protein [Nitrospinae bacterium AH_259_B05_G02_I21]|nr:LamG domain-containing protein [Nitrospinae bacterium AH_259_B05_G02_I21]
MRKLLIALLAGVIILSAAPPVQAFDLTNLKGHWRLNEASGTRVDAHSTNDLTDNNTVTQAAGKIGNAAQFTRANSEYLSRADNADLSLGADQDFTITAWVYLDIKTVNLSVIAKRAGGANTVEYQIKYETTPDRLMLKISDGASNQTENADNFGAVSTGAWIFVVAWHDATADTINIQVNNGTVDSAAWANGTQDTGNAFLIGAENSPSPENHWDGRIDSPSFFKRVLTAQERTDLWSGGNGIDYPFTPAAAKRAFGVIIY